MSKTEDSVDVFNARLSEVVTISAEVVSMCNKSASFLIGEEAVIETEEKPESHGWIQLSTDGLVSALQFLKSALELLTRLQQEGISQEKLPPIEDDC